MKRIIAVMIILPTVLCGCESSKEVDEMAYVTALGIDVNKVTFQFAIPVNITQRQNEKPVFNVTVEETSIENAIDRLRDKLSKKIDFSHASIFIFSSEIAKNSMKSYEEFLSNIKIRPSSYFAICENPESYLCGVSYTFELNPVKHYDMTFDDENLTFEKSLTIHEFLSKNSVIAPILGEQRSAFLENKKIKAYFSDEEIFAIKVIEGTLPASHLNNKEIKSEKKSRFRVKNNKVEITVYADESAKPLADKVLKRIKEENLDVFDIKNRARVNYLTFDEYQKADIQVKNFDFSIDF